MPLRVSRLIATMLFSGSLLSTAYADRLMSETFDGRVGAPSDNWFVPSGVKEPYFVINQYGTQKKLTTGNQPAMGKGTDPVFMVTKSPESAEWRDYYGQADVTFDGEQGGVVAVARFKDSGNFYEAGVFSENGKRFVKIDRVLGGTRTTLIRRDSEPDFEIPAFEKPASGSAPTFVLRVVVAGDEIVIQMAMPKQTLRLAVRDGSLTSGRFGLGITGASAILDNAIVDNMPEKVHVIGSTPEAKNGGAPATAAAAQPAPASQPAPVSQPPAASQPAASAAASDPDGQYLVKISSGLSEEQANQLYKQLLNDGYGTGIRIVPLGDKFGVVAGGGSKSEAEKLFNDLRGFDYNPEGVVAASSLGGNAGPAAAVPAVEKLYRVQVYQETNTREQAEERRQTLQKDDYANVDIEETADGKFRILVGSFSDRNDADQMVENLTRESYPLAKVIEARDRTRSSGSDTPTATALTADQLKNFSPEDQQKLKSLADRFAAAEKGATTAREQEDLRREMKTLSESMRSIIQNANRAEEEKREKETRINTVYRKFGQAIRTGSVDEAERLLAEARAVYPDHPGIAQREQQLKAERDKNKVASTVAQQSTTTELTEEQQAKVTTLLNEARTLEAGQSLESALAKFQEVLKINPQNSEAQEKLRSLPIVIQSRRVTSSDLTDTQKYMLMGGVGAVFAMLAIFGWVLFQNSRREKELMRQVQELAASASNQRLPTLGAAGVPGYGQQPGFPGLDPTTGSGQLPGIPGSGLSPALGVPGSGLSPALGQPGSGLSPALGQPGSGLSAGLGAMPGLTAALSPAPAPAPAPAAEPNPFVPAPESAAGENSTTIPVPFGPPPSRLMPSGDDAPLSPIAMAVLPPSDNSDPLDLGLMPPSLGISLPELSAPEPDTAETNTPPNGISDVSTINIPLPGMDFSAPPIPVPLSALSPEPVIPTPAPPVIPPDSQPYAGFQFNDAETMMEPPTSAPSLNDVPTIHGYDTPVPPLPTLPPDSTAPSVSPTPTPLPPQPTPLPYDSAVHGVVTPVPPLAPGGDSGLQPVDLNRGIIWQENFDDLEVETQPDGWQGEYEYASLTVDSSMAANAQGRCLRFEKRTGAGSANYVCKFPKASGRVRIEFDIRCDDKNKYLLGFYIEKDEDFKQSIHTIVHRMDSKSTPSLRIQGEPIPYEFGTWRHLCYEINLPLGLVTAYVDGEQILKDAKLPTAPSYVNTLSIRDNLATTGVLYLDNISVTRM